MDQAGLGYPAAPAGVGLNEAPAVTMGDRNRAFVENRKMGMSVVDAARAAGMAVAPPPVAASPAPVDDPSMLDLVPGAIRSTAANTLKGLAEIGTRLTGDDEIAAQGAEWAETIGPTESQIALSNDMREDRQATYEEDQNGVKRLAGDVGQALTESAPQLGLSIGSGLATRQGYRTSIKAISKLLPGRLGRVAEAVSESAFGKNAFTTAGAAAPNLALSYEDGIQKALDQGLDPSDPEVRDRIDQSSVARTVFETFTPFAILRKIGTQAHVARTVKGALAREVPKTGLIEGSSEVVDMAIQEVMLDEDLRSKLSDEDKTALLPYVADRYGYDAAVAALSGSAAGGAFDVPGVSMQQNLTNRRLAEDARKAATVLEPMGMSAADLEELTKTPEGTKKLREAVEQLGAVEAARARHFRKIDEMGAEEDTVAELKTQVNRQLDERVDKIAKAVGAPKSLEDVRRERTSWEKERQRTAADRLAQRGLKPKKDLTPEVGEEVANTLDQAEGEVDRLQTRLDATANAERRAGTQAELDAAMAARRQARIDARMKVEGLTSAQAVRAVEQEGKQTEAERRLEAQRGARERAVERQTEIEMPETMAPALRAQRAQEIIAEAEADTRPDAGLDGKIKRLERQRRAATSPEDVDRLTDEIADLEARRGLPTPAVEAARRVLQAQGLAVPQGGEASGPTTQNAVPEGLQPEDAASGPVGAAAPAGPRTAEVDGDLVANLKRGGDSAPPLSDTTRPARARRLYKRLVDRGVPADDAAKQAAELTAPVPEPSPEPDGKGFLGRLLSPLPTPAQQGIVLDALERARSYVRPNGTLFEAYAYEDLAGRFRAAKTVDEVYDMMGDLSDARYAEVSVVMTPDGQIVTAGTNNNPNSVIVMVPNDAFERGLIDIHTHPVPSAFSMQDLYSTMSSGLTSRLVLTDGQVLEIRPLVADGEHLNEAKEMLREVSRAIIDASPSRGPTGYYNVQTRAEAITQAAEMMGMIDYVRPFRGLDQQQKDIVDATLDTFRPRLERIKASLASGPRPDGGARASQAGRERRSPSLRRAFDAEDGASEADDIDQDEVSDLLDDPYDVRHSARTDRRPSVNPERLKDIAASVHAELLRGANASRHRKSPLVAAVRDGKVTVEQIEAGIKAWVENDGYKRMHALGDVVRRMFPDHVIGPDDFVVDKRNKVGQARYGTKYNRLLDAAVEPHKIALELAEKVYVGKAGYIDSRMIWVRNKSGLRFKSGLVVVSDRLKSSLEFTSPPHTRFDPPWPADNVSKIKRDVRGNAFTDDALEPARRTARYLQANRYTLDADRIAKLTSDDMISKKGLAADGLKKSDIELYRKLIRTPRAQWTDIEAKFMARQGDSIGEKIVIAENKLKQLRRAYETFKEQHGPDAETGFLYQVDNRGRIYADGQFNPQGGSAIKAIFKHKGVSLADMTEVDASASGWQINALMARDHIAAPEINLGRDQASVPDGVKSDLYTNTIAKVVEQIRADAAVDVKSLPISQRPDALRRQRLAKAFIKAGLGPDGKLNRDAIKASVIAVNYGGTRANFSKNLRKVFDADMDAFRDVQGDQPWSYIGNLAFESLRATAPHSLALQEWTTSSISKLAEAVEKKYPPGEMPPLVFSVGLEGKVKVKKKKTKEAEAAIRGRTATTFARDANGAYILDESGERVVLNNTREDVVNYKQRVDVLEVDADKIGRAVWANIVQGFDASVLHRAVERYKQMTNGAYITTNHDSFTVPPEHEGAIAASVRESMRAIMEQVDAPARIYQEIMDQAAEHGVEIDVRPFNNMGQYNMDDLMTSTPVFGEGAKGKDYIPDYAEIPEDAPTLRRAVDPQVPEVGAGAAAAGSPPARVPVREQGASDISDLSPSLRRAVDVADYMASLPETSSVLAKVQAAAASPQVANRNLMQILEDTVFNSFAPIRRLEIGLKGKLPDGAESAFKAAEMAVQDSGRQEALLYYGAAKFGQHGEYAVAPGTMGLKDIFKLAGGDGADRGQRLQDWMQWMVARRAQDLAARGIKTPLTPQDIQTALAKGANIPEFQQAADAWKKFNDANLDFLEQSGRINAAQKAAMQADDFYVPFYRSDERVDGTSPELVLPGYRPGTIQAGILSRNPGIKAIKGGDKLRIDNLMQNMIRNSQAMVGAAMRNRAANQTFDLMMQANMARVEPISASKPDPNAVRIWKNGVESWVVPEGREAYPLMTALAGMQPVQMNAAIQLMADVASIFRQGITLTPPFMIRNAIRGAVSSGIMTTGANLTLTNNTITGFREAYNNGQAAQAFKAQAGMGDYRFGNSDAGFGKDDILIEFGLLPKTMGSRFRKFMEKMEHVGSATELADRIAARETMIANGMRPDEASYQALTIMNYSRKGNSQALRAWLPLVPFFNARLQGFSRMAEGAVGKRGMAGRKQALMQMALNGLVLSIISGAIWAWNSDDEERREKYKDEPLYRRLNYHIMYFGDTALYIPKAFELGHVFSSIPELFADAFIKGDMNEIGAGLRKIATDTVTMNMIPAAALPIIEGLTNYSFFRQAELEGMRESAMRPADRTSGASALTRLVGRDMGISDLTGISPTMIEHWASSYGGIYYVMLSTAIDSVASDLGLMPVRPGGAFGDTPFLSPALNRAFGSFLRDSNTTTTKWIEEFYRTKDWITQIHRSATAAEGAGDIEYSNRLLAAAPGRPAAYKLVNKAGTDLSEINAELRKIRDDRSMSREEKRKRETELIQRRNAITKNVMRTIRDIEDRQGATFRSVQ